MRPDAPPPPPPLRQAYSGHLEQRGFLVDIQPRGQGVVNTLRYTLGPLRTKTIKSANGSKLGMVWQHPLAADALLSTENWPKAPPFTVYNDDGSVSPVLHQYDSVPHLQRALDRAALSYISEHFPGRALAAPHQ